MNWLRQSFHRRIWAALTFVVLFSMVTLSSAAYITQRETLEKQFSAQLNAALDSKHAEIRTWLAERISDVTFLSESEFTRQQLARYLSDANLGSGNSRQQAEAATILHELLASMLRSRQDYNRILIAAPSGKILISPEAAIVGQFVANREAIANTLAADGKATPDVYIERISYNQRRGIYEMCFGQVIHAPADDGSMGAVLGILLVTADMSQSVYRFLEDWPMGETGTAVLSRAEADGTRIINQVRYDNEKPLARLLPLQSEEIAKPAQLAARGEEGTKIAIDHLGESVITVYRYIPEMQWGLVLKMNTSEIFAPLRALLMQVLLLAIGVLILATLLAFPMADTLVQPIREFVKVTQAVGSGDLTVNVPIQRPDEIGLLARSFRKMIGNVERHQQQLKAVNQMASGILGARPCDEALYELVQAACQLTGADGAAIVLDDYGCQNGLQWLRGSSRFNSPASTLTHADGTTALYTTRNDNGSSVDISALLSVQPADSPELISTPIWGQERELGTLLLYRRPHPTDDYTKVTDENGMNESALSLSDKEILEALANYAAVVIENARLMTQLQQWNSQLEQRVAERTHELEAVNSQLTQLDEMKTEFIYNVSHELRNPITNLKLQSDLLRKNSDSPRRVRYIAAITKQVDVMAQLVSDMLDLIQLDKMQRQIQFCTIDVNTVVEEIAAKYSERFAERSIYLELDLADSSLFIEGEPMQLRRAVGHLVRNALLYTEKGRIVIRTKHAGAHICLQVQDTGIGIAEQDMPHIFQRFFRGTNVSQSTIPGSGLGLSLVREVATLHRGELVVESKPEHGSTFCLHLPAMEPIGLRSKAGVEQYISAIGG